MNEKGKYKVIMKNHTGSKTALSEISVRYYPYILILIFVSAMTVRIVCLTELMDTHLLSILMGDAELYDIWAREIIESKGIGYKVFFQAPFYPYFLAAVYYFFGDDLLYVRLIQIFFGSVSCVLVAETARYFFSKKTGVISGFFLAIYPAAIYYDIIIQKAVFGLFFSSLILFLIGRTTVSSGRIYWFITGLILGCLVMVRENALILFPVILLRIVIDYRGAGLKQAAICAAVFILGNVTVMTPVAVRNKMVGGEFIPTTYNFGFNLYIGNSSAATGTYQSLVEGQGDWRFESSDALRLAEAETGRKLTNAEVSRYWTRKAVEEIRSDIRRWLHLILKKWTLIWNAVELSDTESIYAYMNFSYALRFFGGFLHFGVLLPLAAAGVCLTWKFRSRLWLFYLFLVVYTAGILPFFVFARYRQIMLPVLIPFAAAGFVYGLNCLKDKKYRLLGAAVSVSLVIAVFSNQSVFPKSMFEANAYYNWASVFENQGNFEESKEYYTLAIRKNPHHTLAYNNLGIINCREGNYPEGIKNFNQAVKNDPRMANPHYNLGMAYYYLDDMPGALKSFQQVLKIDPDYPPHINFNIACVLARLNRTDESLEMIRCALCRGYSNLKQIETDPDLETVRSAPEFKIIMESAGKGMPGDHSDCCKRFSSIFFLLHLREQFLDRFQVDSKMSVHLITSQFFPELLHIHKHPIRRQHFFHAAL